MGFVIWRVYLKASPLPPAPHLLMTDCFLIDCLIDWDLACWKYAFCVAFLYVFFVFWMLKCSLGSFLEPLGWLWGLWAHFWRSWTDFGGSWVTLGCLSFSLALLGVILGSSWQLLAPFGGFLDAQSHPKCTENAKLLTLQKHRKHVFLEGFEG